MLLFCSDTSPNCVSICIKTGSYRQSMLPVTALLAPVTGLTVVTMWSWSCLVKRFTSRRSSSASSQSSKAPEQEPDKQNPVQQSSLKTSAWFIMAVNLLLTRIWCDNNTLFWYPFHICDSSLSLHASFAESLIGGLLRVTIDPNRSLPAPAREARGTEQQSTICEESQKMIKRHLNITAALTDN